MIQLSRYFAVPFRDPEISSDELRDFTEDHVSKLKASSAKPAVAGAIKSLLQPTQDAFDAFDAALSQRASVLAAREGGTVGKDDIVRLFKSLVRQRQGRVKDKFGVGSAQYEEFFPRGLGEFNRVKVGSVQTLLDRMVEKAKKHQAELGSEMTTEFSQLRDQFTGARGGQMESTGGLAEARSSLAAARSALEIRLTLNLLSLAMQHLGEPERAKDYFNQALLEDSTRSQEEEAAEPGAAAA